MASIVKNRSWVYYASEARVRSKEQVTDQGKWMYFYDDLEKVSELCFEAVKEGAIELVKHGRDESGVACFYLSASDMDGHKRVLDYFLAHDLIQKTADGRLYNIPFKLDSQTVAGQYGKDFKPVLKLADLIDLYTGQWMADENTKDGSAIETALCSAAKDVK